MNRFILTVITASFLGSTAFTYAATQSSVPVVTNPQVHQINMRLRGQWKLMQAGLKSGKITTVQAAGFRGNLKSVRQQEVAFFKQNGNHNLTTDQQNQLNQSLNKNSATLGETPVN